MIISNKAFKISINIKCKDWNKDKVNEEKRYSKQFREPKPESNHCQCKDNKCENQVNQRAIVRIPISYGTLYEACEHQW